MDVEILQYGKVEGTAHERSVRDARKMVFGISH